MTGKIYEDLAVGFIKSFKDLQVAAHETAIEKGWHEQQRSIGDSISLMHAELSEALEAARDGNPVSKKIPFFSMMEEEMADVVIRIMDEAEKQGWDVASAVIGKMQYNEGRVYRHGGKAF